MEYICKCNKCDTLFIDTNPQVKAQKFEVDYLNLDELVKNGCSKCLTDAYLTDDVYTSLWEILGDVPCDEEDNQFIEERFLDFEVGTDRETIWHWFEEKFNISIVEDLMFTN